MTLWRHCAHYYPHTHTNQSGQLIQHNIQTHSCWHVWAALQGGGFISCACVAASSQSPPYLRTWAHLCMHFWAACVSKCMWTKLVCEHLYLRVCVSLSLPTSCFCFVYSRSLSVYSQNRGGVCIGASEVSDSLQMFQPVIWWLFTTSTANWEPNCFCGVHRGGCSMWFEARGKKTELGDY